MRGAVGVDSERMWQQAGEEALRGSSALADEPRRPFRAARVRYVVTTAAVVGSAYFEMIDAAAELRAQLM